MKTPFYVANVFVNITFAREKLFYPFVQTNSMTRKLLLLSLLSALLCASATAQPRKRVEKSTDVLALVPAAAGLTASLVMKDWKGTKQLALSGVTAVAVNYALELSIRKQRPDGTGNHAFPSTHAMAAFTGATFLQQRYGWKYGLPAYIVSGYVAFGRVYGKKHDVWDVLAGAAIGAGCSFIYTRKFAKDTSLSLMPGMTAEGDCLLHASLRF